MLMSSESQAQIVRITGKGQFRVSSEIINQVNTLDNEIVDLVKKSVALMMIPLLITKMK